jgi:hypothetical protein
MKMKLFAFAGLVLLGMVSPATAQTQDSTLVEMYLLDFSVPDMPAFKALGTDPSNILRPSDAKKFAASLSPFLSNGTGVIAKNFAVEFSPWKIASSKWTLNEYSTQGIKRFLYNSSLSIGTNKDSTEYSNKVGLGYRVSFLSGKADVLRSAEALQYIYTQQLSTMTSFVELTNYWVINVKNVPIAERPTYYASHTAEFNTYLAGLEELLKNNPNATLQVLYDNLITALRTSNPKFSSKHVSQAIEEFGKSMDEFIANHKSENWNASRLDIAIAYVAQSKDDLVSNAQFSSFSAWVTWALRAHKGGQLLIGTNLVLPRSVNDSSRVNVSTNLRYYVGTQFFRGFLEGQYKFQQYEPVERTLLLNLGAEFRLGSRFWVVASVGINNYLTDTDPFRKLVSSLDLRYGFNKRDE